MDIVEWLRAKYAANEHNMYRCDEAADEIERLRLGNRLHLELAEIKEAEIERLREALQDIALGRVGCNIVDAPSWLKEKE